MSLPIPALAGWGGEGGDSEAQRVIGWRAVAERPSGGTFRGQRDRVGGSATEAGQVHGPVLSPVPGLRPPVLLVYRFRRPDGPDEHLLFVLVLVPLNFAFTGFVNACVHFRKARRSALSDKPEP
jgi:hypothetical protein